MLVKPSKHEGRQTSEALCRLDCWHHSTNEEHQTSYCQRVMPANSLQHDTGALLCRWKDGKDSMLRAHRSSRETHKWYMPLWYIGPLGSCST